MLTGQQPWWSPLKVLVCLSLYLDLTKLLFCGKCPKEIRKTRNLYFAFVTNFTWILSTPYENLHYLLQLQISDETNQHPWDRTCNYIRWNRQFHILGLTLPKNGLWFGNSEKNIGIRISILQILCMPSFRENRQFWLYQPTYTQK